MTYNKGKIKRESTQSRKSNPYSKDIIYDPRGQWKFPGQNTRIPGGNITMRGVNYPVVGVSDKGDIQMMYPNQEYNFPNAAYVDEFPQMQNGGPIQTGGGQNMHEVLSFQKGGQVFVRNENGKIISLDTNSDEYKKLYREGKLFSKNNNDELYKELAPVEINANHAIADELPYWNQVAQKDRNWLLKNKDANDPITRAVRERARVGYGLNGNPTYAHTAEQFGMYPFKTAQETAQMAQAAMVEGVEMIRGNEYDFSNALPSAFGEESKQRVPSQTFLKNAPGWLQVVGDIGLDPAAMFALGKTGTAKKLIGIGRSNIKRASRSIKKDFDGLIDKLPDYETAYRVEPSNFSKKIDPDLHKDFNDLTGRWYGKNEDVPFYARKAAKLDPSGNVKISALRDKVKNLDKIRGANMPIAARQLSKGPGNLEFSALAKQLNINEKQLDNLLKLDPTQSFNPNYYHPNEMIIPFKKADKLRKNPSFEGSSSDALDYVFSRSTKEEGKFLGIPRKKLPFNMDDVLPNKFKVRLANEIDNLPNKVNIKKEKLSHELPFDENDISSKEFIKRMSYVNSRVKKLNPDISDADIAKAFDIENVMDMPVSKAISDRLNWAGGNLLGRNNLEKVKKFTEWETLALKKQIEKIKNPHLKKIAKTSPQYTEDILKHSANPTVSNEKFIDNLIKRTNTFKRSTQKDLDLEQMLEIKGGGLDFKGRKRIDVEGNSKSGNYGSYNYKFEPSNEFIQKIEKLPLSEKWANRMPTEYGKGVRNDVGMHTANTENYSNFLNVRTKRSYLQNKDYVPQEVYIRRYDLDQLPKGLFERNEHRVFTAGTDGKKLEGFNVSKISNADIDKTLFTKGYKQGGFITAQDYQNGGDIENEWKGLEEWFTASDNLDAQRNDYNQEFSRVQNVRNEIPKHILINEDMNDLRKFIYQDGGPSPEQMQQMEQQQMQQQQQSPEFTEQDQQVFAGFMETLPPEIQQAGEILIEIWMQLGKPPQATPEDVQLIGEALASIEQPNQQMPPEAMAQQQAMQQQGAPQGMPPQEMMQQMPPQGMMQNGREVSANININGDFSTVSGDDGTLYNIPRRFQNKNMHYRVNPDSTQKRFFKTNQDRMSNFKRAFTPKDKREPFVQQGVYNFQDGGAQPYIPNNIMNAAFADDFYMNGGSYQYGGGDEISRLEPMSPGYINQYPQNIEQSYTTPERRAIENYGYEMKAAEQRKFGQRRGPIKRAGENFVNAMDIIDGNYQNGGDYQDMELSDAEIADLRAQGYQVDEY